MGLSRTLLMALLVVPAAADAQSFDAIMARGRALLDSNRGDDAVKRFEQAVTANPQSADAHLWLARALGTVAANASILRQPFLGKRAKAEFDRAVELDPKSVGGREGLMQFYLRAPAVIGGSVAKAKEQAAIIATLSPYRGHFVAAQLANNQKDLAGAERAWRGAVADFPDSLGGVVNLASFLMTNGRAEDAFAPLDRFLASHADNVSAQFWVARVAAASGTQLDRGERILRSLLVTPADQGPRIAAEQVHLRLGDIALKRGDKAKAKSEFETALKINPKFAPATRALAGLK